MVDLRTLLVTAALVVTGCGGSEEPADPPAAFDAAACAGAYNADRELVGFGRHAYAEHASRRARVYELDGQCAVVFAVAEDDEEYGTLGLIRTGTGWAPLNSLGPRRATDTQRAAPGAANADVAASGQVALR